MTRSSALLLLALGALSGCEGLRGCGSPAAAPAAVSPAATAPTPAAAPAAAAAPELRYTNTWLVIVHTSPVAGEGAEVMVKVRQLEPGVEPVRLSSTPFVNLRPCLEVLVARSFPDKAAADAFQKRLSQGGVEAYVKNTGALVPDLPARQALCVAGSGPLVAGGKRVVPFLLENHEGGTFALLGPAADSSGLEPVDERRTLWRANLPRDPEGRVARGASFDVYSGSGPQHTCGVERIVKLHRDMPHFGYFQQDPPPDAPGCGDTTYVFAELDCVLGGSSDGTAWFVLPKGTPEPLFYDEETPPDAEGLPAGFLDEEARALRASAARTTEYAEFQRGVKQAEAESDVQETVKTRVFSLNGRHVAVTTAAFSWGLGDCGQGETVHFSRAVVREPDGRQRKLQGLSQELDGLQGVLDLEADGKVEFLYRGDRFGRSTWLVREDGTEVAASEIRTCDSGC